MRKLLVISIAFMAAGGGIVGAAEGRIPLLSLPGPPYVISQPGYYLLTQNMGFVAGTVVRIQSDDVTLDLGGHTIVGSTALDAAAILVDVPTGSTGVTVKNGRILWGSSGVSVSATPRIRARFEGLDISGSQAGITATAEHVEVLGCRIHDLVALGGVGGPGIWIDAYTGRVLDNVVQNLTANGIVLSGFRAGEVKRNVVRNFGGFISAGSGILLQDMAFEPGNTGGAVIADNMVSGLPAGVDDAGILILSPNNLATGNVVTHNGSHGILVTGSENRLEKNVTSRNGGDGIRFALGLLRAHVEANQSQGNLGCGVNLLLPSGVIYRDNTLGNNTGGDICGSTGIDAGGNYCDLALCP